MPNWCFTEYTFFGNSESVVDFAKRVTKYIERDFMKNGFGNSWLGNVCLGFDITTPEELEAGESPRCRGSITIMDDVIEESEFRLSTETAWEPMHQMWDMIIEKFYCDENGEPTLFYEYVAEESGCGLYEKSRNSQYYPQKYYLDFDSESFFPESDEELFDLMEDLTGKKFTTAKECMEYITKLSEESDDKWYSLNEYIEE